MTGTEATDTSDVTEQRPQWSLATLIAFRFGTCYFGSFGLALVIGLIPVILAGIGIDGPWSAVRGLIQLMRPPIEWIGTRLLGLHVEGTQVGSDSAFQWTALFCIAVLSAWATLVWTLLDLRRRRYDRLQTWVWTVLRLLLAAAMFYFGMAKVVPTQMPFRAQSTRRAVWQLQPHGRALGAGRHLPAVSNPARRDGSAWWPVAPAASDGRGGSTGVRVRPDA